MELGTERPTLTRESRFQAEPGAGARPFRVAVLAHVGVSNLGDELLVAATLQHLRQRLPGAQLLAFTMNPEDTRERHGVVAHRVRPEPEPAARPAPPRGLARRVMNRLGEIGSALRREARFSAVCSRHLSGVDLLLIAGSSQIIEAYGGWRGFPWTLLRWTALARAKGARVGFLSMGAEPLSSGVSRWMVRSFVALASYVSVRDTVSQERLAEIGVRRRIPLVPDLGLAFDVPALAQREAGASPATVGINAIPYFHPAYWRASDPAKYEAYIGALTDLAESLLTAGHRVVLYGTTEWADRIASNDVRERLRGRVGADSMRRLEVPEILSLEDLWRVLAGLDLVVAGRYHGVVTALLMGKPTLALAYEEKTADVMRMMGLGRYALDISAVTTEWLSSSMEDLRRNAPEVREKIREGTDSARGQVEGQFDSVLRGALGAATS